MTRIFKSKKQPNLTMSKILKRISQLERLHDFIRRKATGTPTELAQKMELSERTIFNLLDELRTLGASIEYDKFLESYRYGENFVFPYKKGK
jgi:predicted DNA-binding transcriptional regulator YafY